MIKNIIKRLLSKSPRMYNFSRLVYFYMLSYVKYLRFHKSIYEYNKNNKSFVLIGDTAEKTIEIAFVSILPPNASGIATTTYQIFSSIETKMDIFSQFENETAYYKSKIKFSLSNNNLYPISLFFELFCIKKYRKIIIAVGGSSHHSYVACFLDKLNKYGISDRVVIYLHDVYVHNLFLTSGYFSLVEYVNLLNNLYLRDCPEDAKKKIPIFDSNVLGLKVFNKCFGISEFLVNSQAAADLVTKDLYDLENIKVSRIFLPLFEFDLRKYKYKFNKEEGVKYIGSFGIPGPAKKTDVIIDAVNLLNKRGINCKLILAGWGVEKYCRHKDLTNVEYFENLSDLELFSLISQIDLAVQLRASNTGESSGCVPLTLEAKIPTIVSRVGSFAEFGNSVVYFDNSTVNNLCELIRATLSNQNLELKCNMALYVKGHGIKNFMKSLHDIYK